MAQSQAGMGLAAGMQDLRGGLCGPRRHSQVVRAHERRGSASVNAGCGLQRVSKARTATGAAIAPQARRERDERQHERDQRPTRQRQAENRRISRFAQARRP